MFVLCGIDDKLNLGLWVIIALKIKRQQPKRWCFSGWVVKQNKYKNRVFIFL